MIFLRAVTIARAGRSVACAKVTAADITLRDRVWRARCVRHIAHRSGVGPDSGHIEQLAGLGGDRQCGPRHLVRPRQIVPCDGAVEVNCPICPMYWSDLPTL